MKRVIGIILGVASAIFIIADAIHEFIANDTIHYFSEQPRRLLLVGVIGIFGGLVTFGFSALSPRLQRKVKLVVLGSGAGFVTLAGGYLSFQVFNLPALIDQNLPRRIPWLLALGTIACAAWLWLEFYKVLTRRNYVA